MARMALRGAAVIAGLMLAGALGAEARADEAAAESTGQPAAICLTAADLQQIKEIRPSLAAADSPCDTCVNVAAWIIGKVGCGAGEAVLDITCTAAEIVFFEADEIIAPICTGLEIGLGALCEEFGADWIASHTREAATIICQNIALCPKTGG